jgi:acyl carrier protein
VLEQSATEASLLGVVRSAVISAKSEVLPLRPDQVDMDSVLAEPPIVLDSLEFVAMITHLEDTLGLPADDDHIAYRSMRTVGDVVAAARTWLADSSGADSSAADSSATPQ